MEQQAQSVPEKKKWYKKWWVIAIGIFFLYFIGSSGPEDVKNNTEKAKEAESGQSQAEASKPAPESFTTPEGTLERKIRSNYWRNQRKG